MKHPRRITGGTLAEPKRNLGGRPLARVGSFSLIHKGDRLTKYPHVRLYLEQVRRGIIEDLGGEGNLSTAQMILVDRLLNKLAVVRLIEEKVGETGVFRGENLASTLDANFLAYVNSIRLTLTALGLKRVQQGDTLEAYIKRSDAAEAAAKVKETEVKDGHIDGDQ